MQVVRCDGGPREPAAAMTKSRRAEALRPIVHPRTPQRKGYSLQDPASVSDSRLHLKTQRASRRLGRRLESNIRSVGYHPALIQNGARLNDVGVLGD